MGFMLFSIGIGGGIGAILRYIISSYIQHISKSYIFPWGTLGVNLLGSFIIGLLFVLFEQAPISPTLKMGILTGFIGGFTTFSTFSLETVNLFVDGEIYAGIINITLSIILGILMTIGGIIIGKILTQ